MALRLGLICALVCLTHPLSAAVKLVVREGRPFVDGVFVNGHGPYRFLLDTGTNINLIEARLAIKIGMDSTFRDEVASSIGRTSLAGGDGNAVELGPVRAERQRFQYSSLEAIHQVWPDVRGVLGQAFLRGFDYMIDLRNHRLEFGKQAVSGSRAEAMMHDGRQAVSTSLGDLVLDSGASRLVLFGVVPNMRELSDMLTVAGTKAVGMVTSKLSIGTRNIWRGDAVAIPEKAEPGVAGLMPLSLFDAAYISNSEGYVVLQ